MSYCGIFRSQDIRGSFQKFCTLCFFFKNEFILQNTFTGLQGNLHFALSQRSNIWESLVFLSGRLLVDASDYLRHLIRHLLNPSEAFATEWFHRNKWKSGGYSPTDFDLFRKLKKPLRGKSFRSIEELSNEVTWVFRRINIEGVQTEIQNMPKCWTAVIKYNGVYIEDL
jgi:hypothetical protein